MLSRLLIVLVSCLASFASAATTNTQSPLGVNVREIRYWGTEMHLVDFFKRAGNGERGIWLTQCAWPCANNTKEQDLMDVDANGWPKSLPTSGSVPSYRYVTTILWQNSAKLPNGRWTVFYDGEGTLSYGPTHVTRNASASTPGKDVFDVAAGATGLSLSILATDPKKTGNYLRNIRVIPPGGTCNKDIFSHAADASSCPSTFRPFTETYATEPFHPQFLSDLRPFSALRFMQFLSTNLDQTTEWSQRLPYSSIAWGYDATKGAPYEVAIDIANTLDASPWLNVPAKASDDYVTQYARLVKSRIATSRPIYLEYGNEVWNGFYPYSIAGQWIKEQGKARWPSSSEPDFAKQQNWFAMRTKQICAIWKKEFGDRSSQVKCVMGAQGSGSWATDHYLLSCPLHAAEAGGSACDAKAGIDSFAVGFYVGGHVSDANFQSYIESNWFTEADGGLTRLFQEITTGDALVPPAGYSRARASVALIKQQLADNKVIADKYGVPMVVYEGGNELLGNGTTAYLIKLQALAEKAQRDPRMGTVYKSVLDAWKAVNGQMYMVFESTGAYSGSRGNSALLEYTGQPRSEAPKYDATVSFIESNACWWTSCGGSATSVAPASMTSQADCLFTWAERTLGEHFYPPTTSATVSPYYYRHYSGTGNYLGLSITSGHLLLLGPRYGPPPVDLGAMSGFLADAGC